MYDDGLRQDYGKSGLLQNQCNSGDESIGLQSFL